MKHAIKIMALLALSACLGIACSSKEKPSASTPEVASLKNAEQAKTKLKNDSAEAEKQKREEAAKQFCEQFSVEDLLRLLNHAGEPEAEKSGMSFLFDDSVDDDEEEGLSYSVVAYGRNVEKGKKLDLGYQIVSTSAHSCYFTLNVDTSTNPRLYFANQEDANNFFQRASSAKRFDYDGETYTIQKEADSNCIDIMIPWVEDELQTKYSIHPPKLENGFYEIWVEVYV